LSDREDYNTGLGIVLRSNDITRFALARLQLKEADVVICPDVSGIHWSDFEHLDECLVAGEKATREKMDEIRSRVKRKKLKKVFGVFRGHLFSPSIP
jgi:predicted acylesterase/phospholipase RssA